MIDQLSKTFAALADPTRRAILERLKQGEATVSELAEPFSLSMPAVSKHIAVLEQADLIEKQKDAQRRTCRLRGEQLVEAVAWLVDYRRFWEGNHDRIDAILREMNN